MKIAQIAPLIESIPPKLYGGTERAVSYLTEELVRQGHDVVLFGAGDSETSAQLVSCTEKGLRLSNILNAEPYNAQQLEQVRQQAEDFDILHFHTDFSHFPMIRDSAYKAITTIHGRIDVHEYLMILMKNLKVPLVSISEHQRSPLLTANWLTTIPHGLPKNLYTGTTQTDSYFAFLGRICPEKGIERAIEIAKRAGIPLKIAAKIDPIDQTYFDIIIRPLLTSRNIEYIGEISDPEKQEFLGRAQAVLFPITWPEPFGLVMIEAMACGTPVIGWRMGSVPEVINDGISGYIVDSIDNAVAAIRKIDQLDRNHVRECFDQRFTIERETAEYLRTYQNM
jgi:glycosyltransferase involved in cell wall biosynthesis